MELVNYVLGGESLKQLNNRELDSLLDFAQEKNINTINTARAYGTSESLIGKYSGRFQLKINTATGTPFKDINSSEIISSVDTSLRCLRIEKINCLYLHTIKIESLNEKVISTLLGLIQSGKIGSCGYSGDGNSLQYVLSDFPEFTNLMATFNLVDQGNLSIIRNSPHINWTIKRPLANGIWNYTLKKRLLSAYQFLNGEKISFTNDDYYHRFKILNSMTYNKIDLNTMVGFIKMAIPYSEIAVGVKTPKQLDQILTIEGLSQLNYLKLTAAYSRLIEKMDLHIKS